MTLVISVSTPTYGLQVGDRLVSRGGQAYDPLANKAIALRTSDGLFALGYSGLAFLEGVPTDEWLASQIAGPELSTAGNISYGSFRDRDTGTLLRDLSSELAKTRFVRYSGGLVATGWQWNGRRERALVRHVLWTGTVVAGEIIWTQTVPREREARKKVFRMNPLGSWPLDVDRWNLLVAEVGECGDDWEAAEQLLVAAIREASERTPETIGPHCMSTLVRPWCRPSTVVRFHPAEPHMTDTSEGSVQVAYTPWLIAADAVHAPSLSIGGLTCEQGLLPYSIETLGSPPGQSLVGLFARQNRPSR